MFLILFYFFVSIFLSMKLAHWALTAHLQNSIKQLVSVNRKFRFLIGIISFMFNFLCLA